MFFISCKANDQVTTSDSKYLASDIYGEIKQSETDVKIINNKILEVIAQDQTYMNPILVSMTSGDTSLLTGDELVKKIDFVLEQHSSLYASLNSIFPGKKIPIKDELINFLSMEDKFIRSKKVLFVSIVAAEVTMNSMPSSPGKGASRAQLTSYLASAKTVFSKYRENSIEISENSINLKIVYSECISNEDKFHELLKQSEIKLEKFFLKYKELNDKLANEQNENGKRGVKTVDDLPN